MGLSDRASRAQSRSTGMVTGRSSVPPRTSAAHTGIEQATSEIKILDSLAHSIEGTTAVGEIVLAVCAQLTKSIPGCTATIEPGEHEGIPVVFGDNAIATICVDRPGVPLSEDEL